MAALVLLATPASGQMHGPRMGTRAALEARLSELQNQLQIADAEATAQINGQIAGIARRLREGDLYPGDVVDLRVGGETRWTAQFTVTPMRELELEDIDPLDVSGVLFSELEESLTRQLSRYLREPRVQVTVLKRIGITGAVGNPGFFVIDGASLLSEALMVAGGPAQGANLDDLEVRRLGRSIGVGEQVVWQSLSLDQLGVVSGDEVHVPAQGRGFIGGTLAIIGSLAGVTWLLIRIF